MKKSKKILSVALAALMLATVPATGAEVFDKLPLFSVTANAEDVTVIEEGTCGENAKYVLTEDGTLTINPINAAWDYADVESGAFEYRTDIINIIVGEGIIEIKESAFYFCENVESISLPDSLETFMGDYMGRLTRIHIPANLKNFSYRGTGPSILEEITVDPANSVFDSRENCNALFETATNTLILGCNTTVIPDSTEHIGDYAFDTCFELETVSLPEGLKSIGCQAFANCIHLESVVMPQSVTELG